MMTIRFVNIVTIHCNGEVHAELACVSRVVG